MRYVQFGPKMFLVEQPVPKPAKVVAVDEAVNHIWEVDRSGSMGGTLQQLVQDLKVKSRDLAVGDILTVGWFSGEGQFNWALKGFKITEKDFGILDKAFDAMATTVGTTCFSEILADTSQVVKDLSIFSNNFALVMFTDGHPVVSNYNREVENIFTAIKNVQGKIASALLVGYGDYYNKTLMSDMAERFGGQLVHSSNLDQFKSALTTFVSSVKEMAGTKVDVKVEIPYAQLLFSVNDKAVSTFMPSDEVLFTIGKKTKDFLYGISQVPPKGGMPVKLTDATVKGATATTEPFVKAAYALAYILTQRTKTDQALEVLGTLGDVALVDTVTNAFTNEEYGKAEEQIATAMASPSSRFSKGRNTGYLPPANAYCLLDALDDLSQSKFVPYDSRFEYKRTGRAMEKKEDFPDFNPDRDTEVTMDKFVWNETKLNLSLQAQIQGTVKLLEQEGKSPSSVGLKATQDASIFRNYTIVKDGNLNVSALPVVLDSQATFNKIKAAGLIDEDKFLENTTVVVHLDRVPIVNRSLANGKTSATELCEKVVAQLEIKGKLKALKYLYDGVFESIGTPTGGSKSPKVSYGEQQRSFLKANGVDPEKGTFSPPMVAVKTEDFYMAKSFEIKVKGLSSLPKVSDVVAKLDTGKKLTPAEELVAAGLREFHNSKVADQSKAVKLSWLGGAIQGYNNELKTLRRATQETKFAVILGKKWFDEFTSREDNVLTINGRTCTVSLGEEKVPL